MGGRLRRAGATAVPDGDRAVEGPSSTKATVNLHGRERSICEFDHGIDSFCTESHTLLRPDGGTLTQRAADGCGAGGVTIMWSLLVPEGLGLVLGLLGLRQGLVA